MAAASGCVGVPPDFPACQDLGESPACEVEIGEPACGHCVYAMSGKEIFVGEEKENFLNGKPWSVIIDQSVLLPAIESYAPLSDYLQRAARLP